MVASVIKSLRSRILESSIKLSKILAMMKHYKKSFLMMQILRKVLSLHFDFSETNSRVRTQTLKSRVSTEADALSQNS